MTDFSTYVDQWGRAVVTQQQAAMAAAQMPLVAVGQMAVTSIEVAAELQALLPPPVFGQLTASPSPRALPAPDAKPKTKASKAAPKAVASKPVNAPVASLDSLKPSEPQLKAVPAPTAAKPQKPAAKVPADVKDVTPEPIVAAKTPKLDVTLPKPAPSATPKAGVVSVTPAGGKAVSLAAVPEKTATPEPVQPSPKPAKSEETSAKPKLAASKPKAPKAKKTAPTDDLTRIKGVGPKLALKLNEVGVTSFAQIAAWTQKDVDAFDAQLGSFAGRAKRGNWVAKAKAILDGTPQP